MTLPTNELQFLIDNPSLHDSKGEMCVESQEDDQTYLMSVPACSIPNTADVVKALATQRIADAKRIAELEAALRQAKKYLEHEPEYHDQGMGCGLEDRNITDRYDAMAHGWDQAMERAFSETVAAAVEEINTALEAAE